MKERILKLSRAEVELLGQLTVTPTKLDPILVYGEGPQSVMLSRDDAEEFLGYIAAEPNHATSRKLESSFDALYERVLRFEQSFKDGSDK